MRDARAGEFTEATEYDPDEYDSDESATAHPLEGNLSRYLRPGLAVRDLSASAAFVLNDLELDPEAASAPDTGLEEHISPINVLSRPFISIFASILFDFTLAEAEEEAQEWWDDDIRPRHILCIARVLDGAFLLLALWAFGTPGAPWKHCRGPWACFYACC